MADYTGIEFEEILFPEILKPGNSDPILETESESEATQEFELRAASPISHFVPAPRNFKGSCPVELSQEAWFGGIHFEPIMIDEGIIIGETFYNISIWNTNVKTARILSQIIQVNPSGTEYETENLPATITPDSEKIYLLTILKDGPVIQNTTYQHLINAEVFNLIVMGERLKALSNYFEHNWRDELDFSLSFDTVIAKNKNYVEQRRPRYLNPERSIVASFQFKGLNYQAFQNELKKFKEDLVTVPLFQESLTPKTEPLIGVITIEFKQTISEYYFLINRTAFMIIRSIDDNSTNEVLEIDSIDTVGNKITFRSALTKDYVRARTKFYPMFLGLVKENFQITYLTNTVAETSIEFEDFESEG